MVYTCRTVTKVFSNLGTLTLCTTDDRFDADSDGLVIYPQLYYFFSIPKGKACDGIRASLLLYSFDLCLYPQSKPITVSIKRGDKYEYFTVPP